jgi:hypothetical protein
MTHARTLHGTPHSPCIRRLLVSIAFGAASLSALGAPAPIDTASSSLLEEIVVTGDLRESSLQRAPLSVTVIDEAVMR